jgi:hypothetical protein
MEPLDFLAAVLPPPGNGRYCVAELTKKKEHVYVETLEEAQVAVDRWNKSKFDIYFGLSTFGDADARTAANGRMTKCIAIDIDCNHPKDVPDENGEFKPKAYPSARAAAQAILDFSTEVGLAGLGEPWMVASGGGVHAYWPLKEAVEIAEWKPVAEAFKRLCIQKKLGIDPTVTGDAARVLRVPATTNTGMKGNKRVRAATNVRFMHEGSLFALDDIRAVLERNLAGTAYEIKPAPSTALMLPGVRPSLAPASSMVKLFENSTTKFGNIVKATGAGVGCGQLAHYLENAADDGMEPLWRGLLSIAQKCEDGPKAVVWLSNKHPYDEARMRAKLAEIKGPYPCTKLDSENPGVCTSCVHWGKITNPLALGRSVNTVTEAVRLEVPETESSPVQIIDRPAAPMGFAYGERGGVFMEREDEDAMGAKIMRRTMLTSFDLFPVDILNCNGEHTIHLTAIRPTGPITVTLPQKAVVSRDDTLKHLANQNILAAFGAGNDKNLFDYIRASVELMSTSKPPIKVPAHYGWQEDDSFVFSGSVYKKGSEPFSIPMQGLENITNNTKITGSIEAWREFVNLLIKRELWDHLSVMLLGAGSPLMRFTGLSGLTVHCASRESGTGKSLALDAAASIWGHPMHYRTGSGTSPVAMQQRLGLLHSLPMITDEITSSNHNNFEWFPAFVFSMSEGRGKERMESGSNKERLNLSTWAGISIMSSNTYTVDWMTGARKYSSEGELRRMLEFVMEEKLSWTAAEIRIIKTLQNNYAVAGDIITRFLVNNIDEVRALTETTVERMYPEMNATNDERFWMAGVGCAVAAGLIFGKGRAGIVDIPLQPIMNAIRAKIELQRKSILGGKRTAEDVLNAYVREYFGKFVIVHYGDKARLLAHLGNDTLVDKNTTRSEVMGRVEHGVVAGCVDFFIEERLLKTYCSDMSFGYSNFTAALEKQFTVSYVPKKDLLAKTSGPTLRVAVIKITRRIDDIDEAVAHSLAVGNT